MNNIQAHIKANGCSLTEQERVAYCLMYTTSLLMANHAARAMRQFVKGRDKQVLGREMRNREARLKEIGGRAWRIDTRGDWEEGNERIEMQAELIAQFALLIQQFNNDDEMVDFFHDRLKLIKLDAIGHVNKLMNERSK